MKTTKQQKQQPNQHAKTHSSPITQVSTRLTFSDHIRELRRRALWVALVFGLASSLAYNYHDQLVQFVMAPLHGQKLIYLTPSGGFSFIFQITLYAGLVVAAPMLMYQLYAFVRSTLPASAQKSTVKVVLLATILMLVGVGYGYVIAVPTALAFLSTFAGSDVLPNLTADSYLSFFLSYVAGLALLFQLPLLLIFWHWIKPMKPGGLLRSERYIILFAFIAAALITPTPDVLNQSMIAVPLIALYQIGVVVVLISIRHEKRKTLLKPAPAVIAAVTLPSLQKVAPKPIEVVHSSPLKKTHTVSVDGFRMTAASPKMVKPTRLTQPLRIPSRPRSVKPIIHHRPSFRMDDISPLY